MLRLDLARLKREGSLRVEAEIPEDDPLWRGAELELVGPVVVSLFASEAGSGEVVVRGGVEATRVQPCRRCLEAVETGDTREVTLVYRTVEEQVAGHEAVDDGETRTLDPRASEVDLGDAIREELILTADRYVVCWPECRGLCPRCGINRNRETCECTTEEADPRWDVLRTLKTE